jgi:hypothetical protein
MRRVSADDMVTCTRLAGDADVSAVGRLHGPGASCFSFGAVQLLTTGRNTFLQYDVTVG